MAGMHTDCLTTSLLLKDLLIVSLQILQCLVKMPCDYETTGVLGGEQQNLISKLVISYRFKIEIAMPCVLHLLLSELFL